MCGIAGILNFSNRINIVEALMRMSQALKVRGPDDEGYMLFNQQNRNVMNCYGKDSSGDLIKKNSQHIAQVSNKHFNLGLLHRRLSILDTSIRGHQPYYKKDDLILIYNGEIYNVLELKNELQNLGYEFDSHSDTEVLYNAYLEWGKDCLYKLNGMFAFAFFNAKTSKLFLARDRVGEKPLYYYHSSNFFIFSSDITSIVASNLYKPQADLNGLYHGISFGVASRPTTMFKDIISLPSGCYAEIDLVGNINITKYWALDLNAKYFDNYNDDYITEYFDMLISDSVNIRTLSDVPVGTFMSGGIDSTMVTVIAKKYRPDIKAFTLAFNDHKYLNELEQASITAQKNDIEHIVKHVDSKDIINDLSDMAKCYEEPFYDVSPNYIISKFVSSHGIKVVLNGLGGDELFCGYPYYNNKMLKAWQILQYVHPLLSLFKKVPQFSHILERFIEIGKAKNSAEYAIAVRDFITDDEKQALFCNYSSNKQSTPEYIYNLYFKDMDTSHSSLLQLISYIDIMNYIANHHLYRVDRFTMRFSLESRLPLLDYRLIERALVLPDKFKIRNSQSKYLLRKLSTKYIPEECLKMKKKGFDLPTNTWMRKELNNFVLDRLQSLKKRDIFNSSVIDKIYKQWSYGFRSFRSVWQLVSIENWFQVYFDAKRIQEKELVKHV